jgi:lipopolysaccharide/colanic/teichoic acid biosynthesis glycosyltransferase
VRAASETGMMHENTELDVEYVERLSPGLDAYVLLSTVVVVLARRGQ